ncbi:hypothetical protein SUGI_0924870 [Cryptomeria japonica]|uniref:protein LAZY 1 n=1 Tax=Cryptomeria japonica TaxID=3369 RepID=UPI002414A5EF|nr:protein LAZY 1 [Cryptomeria japonica]GLJ44253.1 hypothetical protein SUGI_0924870 [Cryptomeria japonica]
MKIFEWVHRKFRNGQGVKDSCEGRGASEEDLKGHRRDERGYAEEEEEVKSDLTGLLAIGTLGIQPLPHPQPPVEEGEENEEEDEEARVQLLYKQLEEAFGLPSSDCSSPMQEKHSVYPLHEFLHSPLADHNNKASFPTTTKNVKESRTSLGDLFSKSTQKSSPPPANVSSQCVQNLPLQIPNTSAKPGGLAFVKKLLKRKTGKNSGQGVDPGHKLVKVIGQFRRKIHPEEMAASCVNAARSRISSSKDNKSFFRLANCILPCQRDDHCGDMEAVDSTECHHPDLVRSKQPCTKEHWIKTDAEYVVLEL